MYRAFQIEIGQLKNLEMAISAFAEKLCKLICLHFKYFLPQMALPRKIFKQLNKYHLYITDHLSSSPVLMGFVLSMSSYYMSYC